nr:recombinase zinc beta ribbon domain-containing protein [Parvularcula sp. IMCC14364]
MHKGLHEPIISLSLWQKVQDKLDGNRNRPARSDLHEDFPLRNFVACDVCGGALTAGWSKGRSKHYGYYSCQARACNRYGKSIRKDDLEGDFAAWSRT